MARPKPAALPLGDGPLIPVMKLPTEVNSGVQIVTHNGVTFVNPSEHPGARSWREDPEPALITGSIDIALKAVTRHKICLHLKNILVAR